MTEEEIETLLDEFRQWLHTVPTDIEPPAREVDLLTLVNEFSALRHEVKLLTKATRLQNEQLTAALDVWQQPEDEEETGSADDWTGLLEAADALQRATEAMVKLAATADGAVLPPRGGIFARLFGGGHAELRARLDRLAAGPVSAAQLRAAADGLTIGRQRFAAALAKFDLRPIEAVGQLFDPETMEALDTVAGTGQPTGTVIDVIRTGYRHGEKVVRCVQVRVAK